MDYKDLPQAEQDRIANTPFRRLNDAEQVIYAEYRTTGAMYAYHIPARAKHDILSEVWIALATGENPLNAVQRWKRAEAKARTREVPISNLDHLSANDYAAIERVYGDNTGGGMEA